jgi:phosphatidate cytidylyltransferase
MLTTRLWMGTLLVLVAVGMLAIDQYLAPWYPFLFVFQMGVALLACKEVVDLLGPSRAPQRISCFAGVAILSAGNWLVHAPQLRPWDPWFLLLAGFVAIVLAGIVIEMAGFHGPGRSMERMALTWLVVIYLGLLPCFFAQLRWLPAAQLDPEVGSVALALAIFVPKCCDIGAYTTGRLLGRHKMTPVLSPKKTWQGAAGGLISACILAVAIDQLAPTPLLRKNVATELGFGVSVGIAAMLGDLAESMMKRDCQRKDASEAVPGFGGVLDVVDSVIFSAPVTYGWLTVLAIAV